MNKFAIVYGWRHIKSGKMYIGYHKTAEIYDGYVFSTEDEEANTAWSYGELERHIIYQGDASIAITLENFLLKHVGAIKNPQFYNRSVGGGVGCVTDFSNLTDKVKQLGLDWINGATSKVVRTKSTIDKDILRILKADILAGKYARHEKESTEIIYALERIQVRENLEEVDHMDSIADKMNDDPGAARNNISPIIIVTFPDGSKKILDGNNTIGAAKKSGWLDVPAYYINSSEFKDCLKNMRWFGRLMNHEDKIKKPNSDKDCRKAVMEFVSDNPTLLIGTDDFKEAFIEDNGDFWTKRKIASTITSVKTHLETWEQIKNNNFKVYSDDELKDMVDQLENMNPGKAIISAAISSCYNSGIGGIMNKMGGLDCWDGIMLISYRSMDDYKKRNEFINKLNKAKKRMHPKAKLQIQILDPFNGLQTTTK